MLKFVKWSLIFTNSTFRKMKNINVAIFARVSKQEGQNVDRQTAELTDFCTRKGWHVAATIEEKISGAKRNADRPELQELIKLASAGKVSKIVVHEVSRLGRNAVETLSLLQEMLKMKVSICVKNMGEMETLLSDGSENTTFTNILFPLLSGLAQNERAVLIERTISGIENARRKGVKLGRPTEPETVADFLAKHSATVKRLQKYPADSLRNIAAVCGVAPNTVRKIKNHLKSEQ